MNIVLYAPPKPLGDRIVRVEIPHSFIAEIFDSTLPKLISAADSDRERSLLTGLSRTIGDAIVKVEDEHQRDMLDYLRATSDDCIAQPGEWWLARRKGSDSTEVVKVVEGTDDYNLEGVRLVLMAGVSNAVEEYVKDWDFIRRIETT